MSIKTHWSLGSCFFFLGHPKVEQIAPLFLAVIYTKSEKTSFLQALPPLLQKVPPVKIVSPPPDKNTMLGGGVKTKKKLHEFLTGE